MTADNDAMQQSLVRIGGWSKSLEKPVWPGLVKE